MHNTPGPPPLWDFDPYARRRGKHGLLKFVGAVLFVALVASPFLPESVRITLPEGWKLRLPRVEIARPGAGHGQDQLAGEDSAIINQPALDEATVFGHNPSLDA